MPKKPRSHQLESIARGKLKEILDGGCGWSVEDLHRDYGEDLLVRIFQQRKATPFSFYIQSKSTDSITRMRRRSSKFSVPVSKAHARQWAKFWEPVFVTLYDAKSQKTYWECIQIFLATENGKKRLKSSGNTIVIDVPEANVLDDVGVKRMFHITKSRFQRHHYETNGVEILFSLLEERAGLKVVDYNFRTGILLMEDRKGRSECTFFGIMREKLEAIFDSGKVSLSNASFNKFMLKSMNSMKNSFKKDPKTGRVTILNEDGTLKQQFDTLEDWHFAERVEDELRDLDRELREIRKLRRAISNKNKIHPENVTQA